MRHTLKAALLISSALIATPVLAQTQPIPPEHYTLDPRGVDLVSGHHTYVTTEVVIGQPGAGGLSYGRVWVRTGWRDLNAGTINASGNSYTVSIGAVSEIFTRSGSNFSSVSNNGSTLTAVAGGFRFVSSSGDLYNFGTSLTAVQPYLANVAVIGSIVKVSGERVQYNYLVREYCEEQDPYSSECIDYQSAIRLESITNNYGYQLKYYYTQNEVDANNTQHFMNHIAVRGINNAIDYCDPSAPTPCNFTRIWPSVTYNNAFVATQATDQSGRTTTYSFGVGGLTGVRFPGSSSDDISMVKTGSLQTTAVTDASGTWSYGYVDSGTTRTTTATGPLGQTLTTVSNQSIGRATSITQTTSPTTSVTTSYAYDSQRRLQRVTQPEGGYAELTYDARGNVTQTLFVPKAGSGLSNLTTSAIFPATCANPVTCNRPTSTADQRGNVTNYEWNSTHGGLESVTLPAPAPGADRPQTRISYAAQTAWYKNSAGVIVAAPTSIILPVSTSVCASGVAPSCVGTAAETRTVVSYGSPGVANNLLPTAVTVRDGTGALGATTTTTYTANGDVASVDGLLPGTDDTIYYRYDDARQRVGVIGADPDGGGPLLRRAQRLTYNPRGQVTLAEAGTVTGVSDANWAAFSNLQQQAIVYDSYGRPTQQRVQAGGTTYSLSQVSYDAAGRQDCVATRMNPAAFGAPPASACTLGATGAFGPDRIAKVNYDAAGRPISMVSGFGSGSPITESVTYTANGKPLTLTDGNGNVSTMVYDGFDRTKQLRYPNASGGGTSTTDYEEYSYNVPSNVVTYRNRAGETETTTYDALNRPTQTVRSAAPSTARTYDNLNRPLTISGNSIVQGYGWDALGRQTHETTPLGTVNYGYDLAGRRTSMQWPDGFSVAYDYNLTGELTSVRENGATNWQLMNRSYDNLGRQIWQGNANGSVTVHGYDGASRLTSLSHDVAGTASDLTLNFTYNPAGQIATRTMSNAAYAYTPGTGTTSYANNGRNQVTNVGGTAIGYDGRQNITSAPMGTYGYNGSNELTSATVSGTTTTLSYGPGGRLYQLGTTRFLYDGAQVIGEYNTSGGLLRRYVPGLGLDNVVTAYEGAGYDRRWLLADERRSVVSITDGSGAAIATNTYDEYGVPGSGNAGRFGYTGQMWLPEAQLYHYRARAYAPTLGRFMQTDPIGYAAGANIYAYVGADPLNLTDPWGLREVCNRSVVRVGEGGVNSYNTVTRCFNYPDFGSPGPDRSSGMGPEGGGGSGNTRAGEADAQPETDTCRVARRALERNQNLVSRSLQNSPRWNDRESLRHQEAMGEASASFAGSLSVEMPSFLSAGAAYGGAEIYARSRAAQGWAAFVSTTFGPLITAASLWNMVWNEERNQGEQRAAFSGARLQQLENGC